MNVWWWGNMGGGEKTELISHTGFGPILRQMSYYLLFYINSSFFTQETQIKKASFLLQRLLSVI